MVRCLSLLVLGALLALASAAEEVFNLRDGRQLTGEYDDQTHVMLVHVGKGKAQISVRPEDIVSRVPVEAETPVESEEHKRIREQAEADQATIDRRQAEVAAKLAEVQALEREKARADAEMRLCDERVAYWHTQGFEIDGRGLTAGAIDSLGQRYQHAASFKSQGFNFDPRTMTIEQMDDAVQAKIDADEIRNAAAVRAAEERAEAEQRARDREAKLRLARMEEDRLNREAAERAEEDRQTRIAMRQMEADR